MPVDEETLQSRQSGGGCTDRLDIQRRGISLAGSRQPAYEQERK